MIHSVMIAVAESATEINEKIKQYEKVKSKYAAGSPQFLLFEKEIAQLKAILAAK